jgi:hypothetical protein
VRVDEIKQRNLIIVVSAVGRGLRDREEKLAI